MKIDTALREHVFEVVKNEINSNDPPETRITYHRLVASGYSEFEVKQLIGLCVAVEIFSVINE